MVTGEALAADLGLSPTAISQILSGKGRYATATRERVLARVRELGYTPHAGARAARLQRFETLALFNVLPVTWGIIHPGLYAGCMEGCAAIGHRLLLETVTTAGLPGLDARSTLLGQRVCDGLLMNCGAPATPALDRLVTACDVPVLWLNQHRDTACVHPDDHGAAVAVTRSAIAHGRRRLAYVDHDQDYLAPGAIGGAHYSVGARWYGVRDTAQQAGLTVRQLTPGRQPFAAHLAMLRAVLSAADRPDTMICYNESSAQLVLLAAAETGLEPGRDLGVVQFCERPDALGRPLATACIPFHAVGTTAVQLLAAAIGEGRTALPARAVPFDLRLEATL